MKRSITSYILVTILSLIFVGESQAQDCDLDMIFYGSELLESGQVTYGREIHRAGDVDNDGHPDILVVAPGSSSSRGKAIVYSGLTGDSIFTYFDDYNDVTGAGGFGLYDDDQYADILVNGVIYSGLTGDTLANYWDIARNGISAGDLDGDGKFDIVVGNVNWSSTDGRVDVISGATGDTLRSWFGQTGSAEWFGSSVAVAGDFDNDGTNDIVIGSPKYDNNGIDKGRVHVYSGRAGFRLFRRVGPAAGYQFGTNVSGAGDLNNDGFDDILVAGHSLNSSSPVSVWAYSGQTDALLYTVKGNHYRDEYGSAMDGIGDINHDGYDDFAVGAHRYDFSSSFMRNRGNVYVYSGMNGSLIQELKSSAMEQRGIAVRGLGDIDGDNNPDFAIGAIWVNKVGDPSSQYRGAVSVYKCPFETDVADLIDNSLPDDFKLDQNYPNPFNPETVLEYSLASGSEVQLEIYNVVGQKVRTLVSETASAGTYRIVWDGRNDADQRVSTGMYLYRLSVDGFVKTKKMLLLK